MIAAGYLYGSWLAQVSDELKQQVPDHVREKAREMARQELQRRLEELDMSHSEAAGYGQLLTETQAHMVSLHDLLERAFRRFLPEFLLISLRVQIWLRRRRSECGLSGRRTES